MLPVLCLILSPAFLSWESEAARLLPQKSSPKEGGVTASIEREPGLIRVVFRATGDGTIYINFPDDMVAGDVVTGTVFAEPAGKGEERNTNLKALQQFVVEVDDKEISLSEKSFQLALQQTSLATPNVVQLLNSKRKIVASQDIPALPQRPRAATETSLPPYGQIGRIFTVACPCDGVMADTDYIKVGGKEILTLAESPRQKAALNTSEVTGPTQIELGEHGQMRKDEFRNVRLKMTASKLDLNRGEQATMRVEVSGLENLKEELPLRLENRSTSVLTMSGGEAQSLTIRPSDVRAGGVYTTERTLRGITVGAFSIDGIVRWNRDESSNAISGLKTTLEDSLPVPTMATSNSSSQAVQHDVGIIPQNSAGCPLGSEHLLLSLDDADIQNASYVKGWTGNITHYSTGTTFGFCRVDGNQFHNYSGAAYAVLQLSPSCPDGSFSVKRLFDNENHATHNWSSGNIAPNVINTVAKNGNPSNTMMFFCLFPSATSPPFPPPPTMTSFPAFYVPYGVFAAPYPAWLATGTVYTDDADYDNQDYTDPNNSDFAKIIYGNDSIWAGRNTYLLVAKVSDGNPCNVNPCPYAGSYDGANCWLGQPPVGTKAFIWSNNFYYTPVNVNQCPKPSSWFDSRNCFVTTIPAQTKPFIWSNMWYVEPICRP